MQVEFIDGSTSGSGIDDELGYFTVEGTYNPKPPYGCEFTITFTTTHEKITFTGWRESSRGGVSCAIFGTWKGSRGSGNFEILPSDKRDVVQSLSQRANSVRIEQLKALGFPEWAAEQAVQETTSTEEAVDWITTRLSGALGQEAPVAVDVREELVSQLVGMGFSTERAKAALRATSNNVEQAVEWLFSQS